ncbi:MAG: flagellar hook capping FlgD N-terminal domain-containing protein [Oscillospiraceae bacterium]
MSDLIGGMAGGYNNYQTSAQRTGRAGENNNEDENSNENSQVGNNAAVKNGLLVEDENKSVKVEDFLNLMIAQLTNQDFMNPMDDTQYVTQLAQFSTMQQMQELAYNSKANFMSSLVGKEVTAAKLSLGGDVNKTTGIVNKLSLVDGKFNFYIEGSDKAFTFEQIMEINTPKAEKPDSKPDSKPDDEPADDKPADGGEESGGSGKE